MDKEVIIELGIKLARKSKEQGRYEDYHRIIANTAKTVSIKTNSSTSEYDVVAIIEKRILEKSGISANNTPVKKVHKL